VGTVALGGCGSGPVRESKVQPTLEQETVGIIVGQSDRSQLRKQLGEPWMSSQYWSFDLFHLSDRRVVMAMMLVPVWVSVADVNGYVLVSYDAAGKVAAYERGFTSEQAIFEDPNSSRDAVQVRAGPITFGDTADRDASFIAVGPKRRDRYLQDYPSRADCTVIVGCANDWCATKFEIDDGPSLRLTDTVARFDAAVAPVRVKPGLHRVVFKSIKFGVSFDVNASLSCAAGETRYVALDTGLPGPPGASMRHPHATVAVSPDMPQAFREQSMLIFREGKWLVPAEPGP
jgi:hypothetical protein